MSKFFKCLVECSGEAISVLGFLCWAAITTSITLSMIDFFSFLYPHN